MLSLTRRYQFCSGHRLFRQEWEQEKNQAVYGRCANEMGHGHNYELYVTVTGTLEPSTGMIVDLALMDRQVKELVLDRLDHRFFNHEIAEFADVVPTSENLSRFICRVLEPGLHPARLVGIRLYETPNNCFEYRV